MDDENRPGRNIRRVSERTTSYVATRGRRVLTGSPRSVRGIVSRKISRPVLDSRTLPVEISIPLEGVFGVFSSSPARGDFLKSLSKSEDVRIVRNPGWIVRSRLTRSFSRGFRHGFSRFPSPGSATNEKGTSPGENCSGHDDVFVGL